MNLNDLTNRLSEKQKERLRNAKSQEDLDQLSTPDKMLLTEDQHDKVSGGMDGGGSCFRPTCQICGAYVLDSACANGHVNWSGAEVTPIYVMCTSCGEFYEEGSEHTCSSGLPDVRLF